MLDLEPGLGVWECSYSNDWMIKALLSQLYVSPNLFGTILFIHYYSHTESPATFCSGSEYGKYWVYWKDRVTNALLVAFDSCYSCQNTGTLFLNVILKDPSASRSSYLQACLFPHMMT